MRIGSKIYATFDGITYSGPVTSINENSVDFTAGDKTFTAVRGVAHKASKPGSLFEGGLFPKFPSTGFTTGKLVVNKTNGVVVQVVNVDISGSISLSDGVITSTPVDAYSILGRLYEVPVYEDSEDDDEASEDDLEDNPEDPE